MIIGFASWEDRFVLGIPRDVCDQRGERAVFFYYSEYADRTLAAREAALRLCGDAGVLAKTVEVPQSDPKAAWMILSREVSEALQAVTSVRLNITTMPRSAIWSCLWMLNSKGLSVEYAYDRPEGYARDWISRDPSLPRLMYKMSGIAGLRRRTALLLLSGYDMERVEYFLRAYEPSVASIGVQTSLHADLQNDERVADLKKRLSHLQDVSFFELDAYDSGCGQSQLEVAAKLFGPEFNVVASSLGPKLTAVSLFRLQKKQENVALAYAYSREYNPGYSHGIGERLTGTV